MYAPTFLLGDSRVRKLTPNQIPIIRTWSLPGAKVYDFYDLADGELSQQIERLDETPLVYVSAGICNLTERNRGSYQGLNIDEVTVLGNNAREEQIETTKCALDDLQRFISRQGGIPVICTVYPMAIGDWNAHRLDQGRTSILTKADQYEEMQLNLEEMVQQINEEIIRINTTNKMKTPLLHKCLSHNRGNRRRSTYKYNLLTDGCHPSDKLVRDIRKSLTRTISLNSTVLRNMD